MASGSNPGVDDIAARLIVTPIVGVAVPNLAGMINHASHSGAGLLASYAWFIGIAYVTWEANLRLYLSFQDRTAWLTRPWHRVRLLIVLICLFTIPFTTSALWLWAVLFDDPNATWRSITMAVITIVAAVTFITHVYETLFLVKEWESDRARGDQLQQQTDAAELQALQSEVNPHTLFNNLNALLRATAEFGPHEIDPIRVVIVSHGPEVVVFDKKNYEKYKEIVDRAASFAKQGVKFEICRNAAAAQGIAPGDLHGFVTVVPAGPHALAYWQAKGYALNAVGATMPTPPVTELNKADIRKQ